MDNTELAFSIIAEAGDARSSAMEAISSAQQGDFEAAEKLLAASSDTLQKAHEIQTDMIAKEMSGTSVGPVGILMVHAQDHLMCAGMMRDMADILVAQCKQIDALEKKE